MQKLNNLLLFLKINFSSFFFFLLFIAVIKSWIDKNGTEIVSEELRIVFYNKNMFYLRHHRKILLFNAVALVKFLVVSPPTDPPSFVSPTSLFIYQNFVDYLFFSMFIFGEVKILLKWINEMYYLLLILLLTVSKKSKKKKLKLFSLNRWN